MPTIATADLGQPLLVAPVESDGAEQRELVARLAAGDPQAQLEFLQAVLPGWQAACSTGSRMSR